MANDQDLLQNLEAHNLDLRRELVRSEAALSAARRETGVPSSTTVAPPPPTPSAPPRPSRPLWGRMVSGARTIVRWAVVAVVAYMALNFAAGFANASFGTAFDPSLTSLWEGVSTGINSAGQWVGSLFSSASAAASGVGTSAVPVAAAGSVAAVAGVATIKSHIASHAAPHTVATIPTPTPSADAAALMPEELAAAAAKNLAATHSGNYAHHAALEKAAHVAADHSMDHLNERHHSLAAKRALTAREHAKSWAERVDASRPLGPKGIA